MSYEEVYKERIERARQRDKEEWGNKDRRYWIEEIKSEWTPFVDKSDVLDYDKILYVLHDNYAFEDYPVAISPNINLLMGLCSRLNEYEDVLNEQDELLKEHSIPLVQRDAIFK